MKSLYVKLGLDRRYVRSAASIIKRTKSGRVIVKNGLVLITDLLFVSQTIDVRDKVLKLFLVPDSVFLRHLVISLQIFSSLTLPNFAYFFHNMKRRDVWHLLSYSDPSLSHEEHISCQGLLWHLVEQCLVVDRAQLG